MSDPEGADVKSPTDSLNRPRELIPPGSPLRFQDLCSGKNHTTSRDVSSGEEEPTYGGAIDSDDCGVSGNPPECLTPTLEDCALSEMLIEVANKDKHYIGGEMILGQPTEGVKLVGQTPTPDECLSPFWIKAFPEYGDDICKDGPGGEKKTTSPSAGASKKKSPVTLSMVNDGRIFVINNGRVVEDGASLGRLRSAGATPGAKDNPTCLRYYHEGMVMELVPGQTPSMKAVDAVNPEESIDGGSAMKEIIKQKALSPVEKCWVESGFCAFLVLRYDDPENPQLETMNSPTLHKTLKDLESKGHTPSDEHFTPLVNIAREGSASQDEYTTALFFTTEMYTYYVHVENQKLVLKKFKTGDSSSEAKPRNNKQFLDKRYPDSCDSKCECGPKGKEEVDGEGSKKVKKTRVDSSDAESPGGDSAGGSSSQLSSPEGSSISPSKSKALRTNEKADVTGNDAETMDSGVEAN